ncbi:MAG TPA: VOC family protein [Phycisphaerae bacterium]|nr:VOC family protein [Phycisphaerae bacterium]HNU46329.1 VOC family protein [Phycisphaerae bacterium]
MANPLCHFELMTGDMAACKAFYGGLFDWQFDDRSMPGYTLINAGVEPTGGMMAKPPQAPGSCLSVYFLVDDIDATLAKASALGGSVIVPRTPIPGTGAFAMIADPEGIVFGILKPA